MLHLGGTLRPRTLRTLNTVYHFTCDYVALSNAIFRCRARVVRVLERLCEAVRLLRIIVVDHERAVCRPHARRVGNNIELRFIRAGKPH